MIRNVCEKLSLPADCITVLCDAYALLDADLLDTAGKMLMESDEGACRETLNAMCAASGIPVSTVFAAVLLLAVPQLQKEYRQQGVPESVMWDSLVDVRCKLVENHTVNGVWGTDLVDWYIRLYHLKIIKLGRLEFEPMGYKWDTPWRGIQKDDPVMNVHIPSTGPLKIEEVLDSFSRAYRFFGYTGSMPVAIASWLTYPPMCQAVLQDGSNLRKFYDLFQVVEQYEDPGNKHFWRVFGMEYGEGILDKVPTDSSLRRGIYEYMKAGNHMGIGRCMLCFDGTNITD